MMYYNAVAVFFWISPQENRLKTEKNSQEEVDRGGSPVTPPVHLKYWFWLIKIQYKFINYENQP